MSRRYWAVVPAAGIGTRMGSEIPKQYLKIHHKPVLQHTLERLLAHPQIRGLVVVIGESDSWWQALESGLDADLLARLTVVTGGAERYHSVLSGLTMLIAKLGESYSDEDWVLVHDAARPCVTLMDITKLISAVLRGEHGGILASPVRDTMKRGSNGSIEKTVDRENLWHALTPQLFPLGLLHRCLQEVKGCIEQITDEASALELAGYAPLLVEGSAENLKITRPGDLELAEFYLSKQMSMAGCPE